MLAVKLSPVQQALLQDMRDGWQLKTDGRSWLSKLKNGALLSKRVNTRTVHKLYKCGLLRYERSFPISKWFLTE